MYEICPRLVDYVVLVGSHSPNRKSASAQPPTILNRFPPCDHNDFILPPDVALFCQPEGCFSAYSSRGSSGKSPVSFVFTLTDKESGKIRYGISLNFYRPIQHLLENLKQEPPPDIVSSLTNPGSLHLPETQGITSAGLVDFSDAKPSAFPLCTHSLTSLCIVTHHPFFAKFRWLLDFLHKLIQKCHDRSRMKSQESETVWDALTGAHRCISSPVIMCCVREIEIWILRLLSTPMPMPGKTCLQLYVQPKGLMRPLLFAMPDKSRLPLTDLPVHLPIQLLGISRALRILVCLLLEQKVVLQSADYNKVSLCVLAFTALLYPLQYMFPVIPLLPPCMPDAEQLLIAPTPYIIGVPNSFYAARKVFRMPKDVWLANLDTQEISYPEVLEEVPDLPEVECTNLVRQLNCILDALAASKGRGYSDLTASETILSSQSASASQIIGYNPLTYVTDEASASVSIRVSMILFLNSRNILGGLSDHTRTLRLYPRPVVAFQFENFMKSRPFPCLFTSMLARTQAVEYFAESMLCAQNEAYQRILAGDCSPQSIGDQPRWFVNDLPSVSFDVWQDCAAEQGMKTGSVDFTTHPLLYALVLARLHADTFKSGSSVVHTNPDKSLLQDEVSDLATDESGSDTDTEVSSNSMCSTLSDVLSDHVDSGIGDSLLKSVTTPEFSRNNSVDIQNAKLMESVVVCPGVPLPSCLSLYFNPPVTPVEAPCSTALNQNCLEADTRQTSPAQLEPAPTEQTSFEAVISSVAGSTCTPVIFLPSTCNDNPRSVESQPLDQSSTNGQPTWGSPILSRLGEWFNSNDSRFVESANSDKEYKRRLEDQRYIIQLAQSINSGSIPGIFSRNRVSTLLAFEEYRNLLLSRLIAYGNKLPVYMNQSQMEDVPLESWNQYKAVVWILRKLILGLESSQHSDIFIPTPANVYSDLNVPRKSSPDVDFSAGFASVFGLLEIAHTHYFVLPKRKSTNVSQDTDYIIQPRWFLMSPRSSASSPGSTSNLATPPQMIDLTEKEAICKDECHSDTSVSTVNTHGSDMKPVPLPVPDEGRAGERRRTITIIRRDKPASNSESAVAALSSQPSGTVEHPIQTSSPSDLSENHLLQENLDSELPPKSSRSLGYRYHCSRLMRTALFDLSDSDYSALPISRHSFTNFNTNLADRANSARYAGKFKTGRTYVFEDLVSGADVRSKLWDDMQFWEDAFLDAVSQERGILGMDFRPGELLTRYAVSNALNRKRAELEEDRLLACLVHNLVAFMVMMEVNRMDIRRKIRRLLAKSHMGLHYSQEIGNLLDSLEFLSGNDIDLKPFPSRPISQQSYEVYRGTDETGDLLFIEVCNDYLLLRDLSGSITDRWWYDQLINISYRLHTHILCISVRIKHQSILQLFYTKKCQRLYQQIQRAMERIIHQIHQGPINNDLSGQLNVIDNETGLLGTIKVSADGFVLIFPGEELFLGIKYIKRCSVPQHDIFAVEYYDRKTRTVRNRKFRTDIASNLLYYFRILITSILALPAAVKKPH